jgi:hypothetical protein
MAVVVVLVDAAGMRYLPLADLQAATAKHLVHGHIAANSAANSSVSLLCMGLFSMFCVWDTQKPSPGTGEG